MKKTLLSSAIAATFLFPTAFAADTAKPVVVAKPAEAVKPAPRPIPPAIEALRAASTEFQEAMGHLQGNPIPRLDKLTTFQHSEATKAKLMATTGASSLFAVSKLPAQGDQVSYAFNVPAIKFALDTDADLEWTPLESRIDLDKEGRRMTWNGAWTAVMVKAKNMNASMKDMSFESSQKRGPSDFWLGSASGKIARVEMNAAGKDTVFSADNMVFAARVEQKGKHLDVGYDFGIANIKAVGEQVDTLRFNSRITRLDAKIYEALLKASSNKGLEKLSHKEMLALMEKELPRHASAMAAAGTAYEIDEMSAIYRGHKAQLSGKISLAPGKPADFSTTKGMIEKLVVRFNLRVPVALIGETAAIAMRKEAEAKGQPMSDAAAAQASQAVSDAMLAKAVESGMVRVDNGVVESALVFKGGKLTVNGKPMALPAPKRTAPAKTVAAK